MLAEIRRPTRLRPALIALLAASSVSLGCSLSPDDAGTGDVEVTLVGNLPNTPFSNTLAPHLSTTTVAEEAAHPGATPVLINGDAVGSLTGTEKIAIQTNHRAGRPVILLNATQRHANQLAEVVGAASAPELFFYPDERKRSPAVAFELEPDGRVHYVLHGNSDDAFVEREVSLFLNWLEEDGARIGERLYNEAIEPEHGPLTDISKIPETAELKSHGEHAQTTRQFVGVSGSLSLTTTSLTAYSCDDERYHAMVLAHVEGAWADDKVAGDELELIQLSAHLPGGELSLEPLIPSDENVTTCGFDLLLEAGATFVLNDNRGTNVFAPVVTHVAKWPVQDTDVPMGNGEAGSHLWTLNRAGTEPGAFSYTTGWKWLFPAPAAENPQTIKAPLGARIGADQREFTLTLTGPTTSICR